MRVKDIDFTRRIITVRDGKGAKDRAVMLPDAVAEPLRHHLEAVRRIRLPPNQGMMGAVMVSPFLIFC